MESNDSLSQLTEFPRLEPEENQSGVTGLISKFLKFPIFTGIEYDGNNSNLSSGDKQQEDSKQSSLEENQEKCKTPSETNSYSVDLNEGRSLQNVLRRLSSLVALGSSSGTRYADTELAKYWMPDDVSKECYECGARFSTLRRRHHCRVCGQIFCSRCCSQRVPGQICGCAGGLRVCTYCCKVVLSYLRSNDMSNEISGDLQVLQENLQIKFPDEAVHTPVTPQDNFMLDRTTNSPYLRTSNKDLLQDLFRQLYTHLPTQQQRFRLLRYNGVWRGSDIVQWIMENTSDSTRSQANAVCRLLLNEGFIESVTEQNVFADYMLYRPAIVPAGPMSDENSPSPSNLLTGSVSSFCLDLNLDESSARLIRSPKLEDKKLSPSSDEDGHLLIETDADSAASPQWCSAVIEAGKEHLRQLMTQCLSREALHLSWLDILIPLCLYAAEITTPVDVYSGDMDIRSYVQIKKVPGGTPKDSCVLNGVVLTKNVAHRGMPQQLTMPSILLLDCSVAYQRVEGKVVSLEPLLLQEQEYLARCAARILALRPAVVLARGGVARAAQDALRGAGVALAVRVGARALRRVARTAAADVVASVDSRIATPRMGSCKAFYVKNYESKTLMILEGCAESKLGCCVILRGAPLAELVRVKRVVRFMLLAAYNWRLEQSFLTDTGATLPDGGISFVDGSKECSPDIDERDIAEETKDLNSETPNNEATSEKSSEKAQINKSVSSKDNQEIQNSGTQLNEEDISVKETIDAVKPRTSKISRSQISGDIKTDPLQANRKSNNSTPSCGVPISDFSDPLRARQMSIDEEVFLPKCDTQLTSDSHGKRWTTEDTVLSMSPHVKVSIPFLETELGRKCHLRQYFCTPLFPPTVTQHAVLTPKSTRRKLSRPQDTGLCLFKEPHRFITQPLCKSIEDMQVRASLAHFRAIGGRLPTSHKAGCPNAKMESKERKNLVSQISNANVIPEVRPTDMDPLAPENHQRLTLLFFSYSNRSANAPDFCVNPWVVCMEMYGSNDISLGNFLDRYCFNSDYKCPSPTCQTPMVQHVRRFVHADSCITITCNTVGISTNKMTLPSDDDSRQSIMWWCRCSVCSRGAASASTRLTRDSLALSLAKYLELRLRAPRYARASACPHSLHAAHAHYFARGTTTACFRYSKIKSWDITLPPAVIATHYNTRSMRTSLINQVNDLMLKGHELFTSLSEGDFEKDYTAFKQHMEQINLALTSSHLQSQDSIAGVVRSLWAVTDSLIAGEKLLRDASDKWSSPPIATKPIVSKTNQESTGEDKPETDNAHQQDQTTGEAAESTTKANSTDEHGCDEDDDKGDKKTIRAILSQLLSSTQPANQHGMIISGGLVPVVVFAGEIGSVVAAGLASAQYHQQLQGLLQQSQSCVVEQDEPETSKEKTESDGKAKCNKNTEHIEVLLKDGLLCRVYHAAQFKKLRALFLSQLSSNTQIVDHFAGKTDHNQTVNPGEVADTSRGAEEKLGMEAPSLGRHVKNKSDGNIRSGATLCEVEEGFIRSLSRCVAWTARGGKSGSTFCKTKDDRYVLKEMSKLELQLFLELAPHYFSYVITCQQQKLPSLLGRIVGVYSVGGAGGGVLVMENLFYGRGATLQHRFDLKGTRRNRLVPDTAQPEAVLMDENLLTLHWESPLYLQAHSAAVLWSAIERDSTFLADHHVMDYSLLLGVDETNNELIIGIIDYIRTFTWDKKLEHIVKKGLGSGLPTIVSPQLYKQRFCSAMKKYFLQSPNQWDGLHRGLISEIHGYEAR